MKQSSTPAAAIMLQRIEIASPCTASWEKMKGDERVRHCDGCNKNVFNLSAMPEAEGAALLAQNTRGELCVRFYRRQDGTVMTSDCSTAPRAPVRETWRKLPGMAGVAGMAVLAMSAAACSASEAAPAPEPVPQTHTMGAPPPTPVLTAPEPAVAVIGEVIAVPKDAATAPLLMGRIKKSPFPPQPVKSK